MKKVKDRSLYLVISREYTAGRDVSEIARGAITGGVDIMQMREKNLSREDLLETGRTLFSLCRKNKVTFIVNDDPYLAKEIGADGVHLGQEDIKKCSIEKAREIIGKDGIIGVSTHSIKEFKKANESDCDYIAFGPIFETKTKNYSIGTCDIAEALEISAKPVIFIGGINLRNIDQVLSKGARNIAVIRAITQARDIEAEAKALKEKICG